MHIMRGHYACTTEVTEPMALAFSGSNFSLQLGTLIWQTNIFIRIRNVRLPSQKSPLQAFAYVRAYLSSTSLVACAQIPLDCGKDKCVEKCFHIIFSMTEMADGEGLRVEGGVESQWSMQTPLRGEVGIGE
jgi:hypothetical protein